MRMALQGYWLPSEFLTDDDFLIDKENFNNTLLDTGFCFPYHFQTQKFRQSTLASLVRSNNGSPNAAKYDAVGDLIYLSAKLKLNGGYAANSCPPLQNPPHFRKHPEISTPAVYLNKSFENIGPRAVRGGMGHGAGAWAPHQVGTEAVDGSGAAPKKVCAGTGVFLPRRYDTVSDSNAFSSLPRRRPVYSASPSRDRESVQIHAKPLMYGFAKSRPPPQLQPKIGRDFVSEHNSVLARRQQRRSFLSPVAEGSSMIGCRDHPRLPPEWTY